MIQKTGEKKVQNFTTKANSDETMNFIYDNIYSYFLNLLINHPPITSKMKRLYKKLFEPISFKFFW